MNEVVDFSQRNQNIGDWMKHPDILRIMNRFHREHNTEQKGIGNIQSFFGEQPFSQDFLDFYEEVLCDKNGIEQFILWLREYLLTHENVWKNIIEKHGGAKIVEFLFLLFHNQKYYVESYEAKIIDPVKDTFALKVHKALQGMNTNLSEIGFDVFQYTEKTIEKGYFPLSERGEILIFSQETSSPQYISCVTFPEGKIVLVDRLGRYQEKKEEYQKGETLKLDREIRREKRELEKKEAFLYFHIHTDVSKISQENIYFVEYLVDFELFASERYSYDSGDIPEPLLINIGYQYKQDLEASIRVSKLKILRREGYGIYRVK